MNRFSRFFLSGAMVLALSGCGKERYLFLQNATNHLDQDFPVKEVKGSSSVDILWVIDNSGSMGEYQNQVMTNSNAFMQDFIKQKLNWKMGLISTDDNDSPYIGFAGTDQLDSTVANPVDLFADAVGRLGTSGSAVEATFVPILQSLSQDPKFLRPKTPLAVIMVTDAEEQSRMEANVFLNRLATVTGGRNVFAYGVFASQDLGCRSDEGEWDYQGSPYETFIKSAYVGQTYPLCRDFGTSLVNIAHDIVTRVAHTAIYLTSRPDTSTLKVLYKGKELPAGSQESGGFWVYDYGLNAVVFSSLDFAVNDSDSVRVVYDEVR